MLTVDPDRLPRHVAIIMDGNGRWARQRGMPRVMGHRAGVESVREVVRTCRELAIEALTLYAFSSENWQRPAMEVQALMGLLKSFLASELNGLLENNVRLHAIGQRDRMATEVREMLERAIEATASNSGLTLTLALSYGSRDELVRACRTIAGKCRDGLLTPEGIDDQTIVDHLDTAGLPDPDLLIRTGGELRLSNFLLWQASYAELFFTPTLWPDFRREDLLAALNDFQQRQRRFGRVPEQAAAEPDQREPA
ncbi:MAG: isoprenyl transferase [Thermodesulfobacteriota bacterium]